MDKSNFNGEKEYVMDTVTLKDMANNQETKTVTLAGQEFKLKDLKTNLFGHNGNPTLIEKRKVNISLYII